MLDEYITRTQRLLQNPAPATGLYSTTSVTDYINIARKQLAGEGECIRVLGTIDTVTDQRAYSFADIDIGVSATNGIEAVFNVRRINYGVGDGQAYVTPRAWEWFDQYCMNDPVPFGSDNQGARYPQVWSQYGQGGAAPAGGVGAYQSGSFYLNPIPDSVYTLYCDCVCYPITLVDDTTPEAIPYPFTDAVPFFAAWYCLLSTQLNARRADAEAYYGYYKEFLARARQLSNPTVLGWQYEQGQDPAQAGKAGAR